MKVRISKRDLVRDGLLPWADDCLGRQSLEGYLENLVGNAFDPIVVAVNGTWGSGKSYFLYNWYLDLENRYKDCEGTSPALYFNSWEAEVESVRVGSVGSRHGEHKEHREMVEGGGEKV